MRMLALAGGGGAPAEATSEEEKPSRVRAGRIAEQNCFAGASRRVALGGKVAQRTTMRQRSVHAAADETNVNQHPAGPG